MWIAALSIANFRGVRDGELRFAKHPVLIGENNAGKTTVIEALTLLLGRDRLLRELTEHDFFGSAPAPATRIKLVATITGFSANDPAQNTDWFREGRAVPKWLDPQSGSILSANDKPDLLLCCQIAVQAYFDHESLSVEMVRYFHDHDAPIDPFASDDVTVVPPKLINQLGFYLVRASRTWDKVLSWGSELFKRAVVAAGAQPSAALLGERDRLREPVQPIEADPQIAALIERVNGEIARCLPGAPKVQLRVTGTDSRAVMDAVTAHFAVHGGPSIPAGRQGSGLVSLQGLMLLLELGRLRADSGEGFLMALEEPELHLPPANQQQLIQRVQALSTQTFITTHSPLLAALAQPESITVLTNKKGELSAVPLLSRPLTHAAPNWERRLFQSNRIDLLTALMQRSILVPEGLADFLLLRTILKPLMLTEGWSATMSVQFGINVGVIPTHDASVLATFNALSKLHGHVNCLVDGDPAGIEYAKKLAALQDKPQAIIRWHNGAVIEDIVEWLLMASPGSTLPGLAGIAALPPKNEADITKLLIEKKADLVRYEAVAEAISQAQQCRARAAELFESLAKVCVGQGQQQQRFAQDANGVWVFIP